jgi:hypothetical protein
MNKSNKAKVILTAVVSCAFTLSVAYAGTISHVSPSTTSFSIQNGASSSGPQLSLSGDMTVPAPPTFSSPVSSGGFTPVSGGPGPVTTQPVVPSAPVRSVPDSGSTVILLGLALLGSAVIHRKLAKT